MASYWIVVPKGNTELFDLLSVAFRGRSDFSVIVDRRGAHHDPPDCDRRGRGPELGRDEFVVAERAEPLKRPVRGTGGHVARAGSLRAGRSVERSRSRKGRERLASRVRRNEPLSAER